MVVLQHPDESRHALNTARLAVLGLQNAELLVGEIFPQLETLIASSPSTMLLFPAGPDEAVDPVPESTRTGGSPLLIVPDGTWRKARAIVRANPVLAGLPRLSLPEGAPSAYRIRKAPGLAALSTVEAIVRALEALEPDGKFADLLRPFHVLVEQQIEAMGEEVYRRNYVPPKTGLQRCADDDLNQ